MRRIPLVLLGLLFALSASASPARHEFPTLPRTFPVVKKETPVASGYSVEVEGRKPLTMKVDGKDIKEGTTYLVYGKASVTVTITFMHEDEKITQDIDIDLREGYEVILTITLPGPRTDA